MEEKYTTVRIKADTLAAVKRIAKQTRISVPKTIDAAVALLTLYANTPKPEEKEKESK